MAEGEASNLHEIGANLMLVDYRGYGSSSPITPDEKTVDEDALAALTYLVRHGESLSVRCSCWGDRSAAVRLRTLLS